MNYYENKLNEVLKQSTIVNYESPNILPILKYLNKNNKKIAVLGEKPSVLSCLKWLESEKITPEYIISDGLEINGTSSISIHDLTKFSSQNIIILLATKDSNLIEEIKKILSIYKFEHIISVYDLPKVPLMNENYIEFFHNNAEELKKILYLLADDYSRETYIEYIRSKNSLDFYRLTQLGTSEKYFDTDLMTLNDSERIVNLGCSNGDTLFYYLNSHKNFASWYAFDSDNVRIELLKENIKLLPKNIQKSIFVYYQFIDNVHKLDDILNNEISLITMDIEGAELNALEGAKELIGINLPILSISSYHKPEDLVELPNFINNISRDYKLYFRKYASTFRNKFRNAELVLYAIPTRKLKK